MVAAFDYKEQINSGDKKLLFLAYRKEILDQSLYTFRNVLKDQNFGELWVGDYRPINNTHLFASVQTLNSSENYMRFAENYFDYIYKIDIPEYIININMDIRAYETIFSNIIQNVIDHSSCNNIIIELTNGEDNIMMIIKDDGIAISEEELIHIFDRLYKIDKSRGNSGNGLGLSIVKQIIEKLDGNVIVKSELNLGMEFQIKIPKNSR